MERKFFTNDFEQLLRENADQFKMFPSKKVWRGIYNDVHPGRRWPSIAMSLIFVFTLILVGHLNTQQGKHTLLSDTPKNNELQAPLSKEKKNLTTSDKSLIAQNNKKVSSSNPIPTVQLSKNPTVQLSKNGTGDKIAANVNLQASAAVNVGIVKSLTERTSALQDRNNNGISADNKTAQVKITSAILPVPTKKSVLTGLDITSVTNADPLISSDLTSLNEEESLKSKESLANKINHGNVTAGSKMTPSVVSHKKIHKNPKINWAYYLSPAISYRTYSRQGKNNDLAYLGYTNNLISAGTNKTITNPSIGLEAGTMMKYSLNKKLRFTTGLQVNYSTYTIEATNVHPIIATLILHNQKTGIPYAISTISYFGNGPAIVPEKLHNYNINLSLPVGLEYQFAGNDHIQFSVAGSFQPSLTLANQSYIISTDKRNYLTQASLSRHWNMSSNLGTFISFNSNKFKWQIGPQVHYQLLSSYLNEYQVREHYIDYGIRLGVSKIIK